MIDLPEVLKNLDHLTGFTEELTSVLSREELPAQVLRRRLQASGRGSSRWVRSRIRRSNRSRNSVRIFPGLLFTCRAQETATPAAAGVACSRDVLDPDGATCRQETPGARLYAGGDGDPPCQTSRGVFVQAAVDNQSLTRNSFSTQTLEYQHCCSR
ncbi:hypothetical protein [Pseudonocardia ammonioxydans]|uniref:hypothetical protein n=1 Tax=Pseudonocardia ammonioxydans TaxID=260086 RepID=UPI000B87CC0B|nr:hypothetical protein [Pseudonocardia ammonioxydans]